jgi:hypothetical protein
MIEGMSYLSARTTRRAVLSQFISNRGSEWYMMYRASSMAVQSSSSSGMVKYVSAVLASFLILSKLSLRTASSSGTAGLVVVGVVSVLQVLQVLLLGLELLLDEPISSRRLRNTPEWILRMVRWA